MTVLASSVKLILSTTRSSKTWTELTGAVPRQHLPAALAQELAHSLPVSCASSGTVHISVANPVRQGLQPGQRGDGGLLRPAQEGVLARQGLVGLGPRPRHRGARGLDRPLQYGEAQRCARRPHAGRVPRRAGKGRVAVQEIVRSPHSCPFGTSSCWGVPAPNPSRNEYSKLKYSN